MEPDLRRRLIVVVTAYLLDYRDHNIREPYLEVTYRHGKILAAYYYLPRNPEDKSCRVKELAPGLLADFREDGQPMGIEITTPGKLSLEIMNRRGGTAADLGGIKPFPEHAPVQQHLDNGDFKDHLFAFC